MNAGHEQQEKKGQQGILAGVPMTLSALVRADRLQRKAANAGFDWPDISGVIAKVEEELGEVREELNRAAEQDALLDECGDLLFAVVNLVRHAGIDPDAALRQGNRKFVRRFEQVEALCRQAGQAMPSTGPDKLNQYWEQVKSAERGVNPAADKGN